MNRKDIITAATELLHRFTEWQLVIPKDAREELDQLCAKLQAAIADDRQRLSAIGVELPEPSIEEKRVCCGNFTTGGEYMGQTETVCCGNPDFDEPAYFTADQLRDYGDRRAAAERENITKFLESHAVIAVNGTIADQIRARGAQL